jgi:predicted nuclease with TOPRIM domain
MSIHRKDDAGYRNPMNPKDGIPDIAAMKEASAAEQRRLAYENHHLRKEAEKLERRNYELETVNERFRKQLVTLRIENQRFREELEALRNKSANDSDN